MSDTPPPSVLRIAVIFGGTSAEHDVSIQSAQCVIEALDRSRYEPVPIGIDRAGAWHCGGLEGQAVPISKALENIDVAFPVLHGPMGEDGTIQGLLEMQGIPYVGSGVLGSAVGMDKDIMKRLLKQAGIPVGTYAVVRNHETHPDYAAIIEQVGLPCYVKPANMGSSVGITKVTSAEDLPPAIESAFRFDLKVIIEANIPGSEIECAVLGNDAPTASLPGKVVPNNDFYSYTAKYVDESGTILEIPARLPESVITNIQSLALQTYTALECSGLGRVDMFLDDNGTLTVNEINTLPGFTRFSMYPKLWEATGMPVQKLVSTLITLALERHGERAGLISQP